MDGTVPGPTGPALLTLALSHPTDALDVADRTIAAAGDPRTLSYAHQARGIVLRDRGETGPAIRQLRRALALAGSADQPERAVDVRATLGAALVMHGRTSDGLQELDRAAERARGGTLATVLMRRAHVLAFMGRHEAALADLRRAVPGIRRSGDRVWEARALNNRGSLLITMGEVARAERDIRRAEELFAEAGQLVEAVHALHNRGVLAFLHGDLPTAFARYDRAARRYAELGASSPDLVGDRCEAYLMAGLHGDAVALVEAALAEHRLQPRHRADLELMMATAALSGGDATRSAAAARRARRRFVRQDRALQVLRCDLVLARARFLQGARSGAFLDQLRDLARRLADADAEESAIAWLLAGRIAVARDLDSCHEDLALAARHRRRASPQVRATAWLARALDRDAADDGPGVLRACGRGLDALDEQLALVGGTQLRALVTSHGDELAATALRRVVRSGDARALLRWTERWRAVALSRPPVRPPREVALASQLAAIRATVRAIDDAQEHGMPTRALVDQRARLEAHLVQVSLRVSGRPEHPSRVDLDRLVAELGPGTLVELIAVDGTLHAVVVRGSRFRRAVVGPVAGAQRAVERARFALRQAARGRPTGLAAAGELLEASVLGDAAGLLGDAAVVISPPSFLSHSPWAMCPSLAPRPVSATPSAASWLRARGIRPGNHAGVALIAGPGVVGGDGEVQSLARRSPGALVLRGSSATVERTLGALDGAEVAHVAAHGHHRRDNPMFSCLDLYDGPLTVHDIEGLRRPPYRVVLSACDSGVMAPVGSDEVLGLASALLALGGSGVVCSVGPVSDLATPEVMQCLHAGLAGGDSPAAALLRARDAAAGDELAESTAASFTALGA